MRSCNLTFVSENSYTSSSMLAVSVSSLSFPDVEIQNHCFSCTRIHLNGEALCPESGEKLSQAMLSTRSRVLLLFCLKMITLYTKLLFSGGILCNKF